MNYSRSVAQVALHFNQVSHTITTDELNSYLYRLCVHDGKSEGYFNSDEFLVVRPTKHKVRFYIMRFRDSVSDFP